jgi:dihydrofolate reductase
MLVVQEFVTVDGFAADAKGEFGFGGVIPDWSPIDADQLELIDRTGTIVLGRKTYELFVDYWPTAQHVMAKPINTTARAVLSQTLHAAPWGDWAPAAVQTGSPREAIGQLAAAAAPKDLLVWGSLALAKSLLRAGLVDELRLIVCPVALGTGIGVIPEDLGPARLKFVAAKPYSNGAVALTYNCR